MKIVLGADHGGWQMKEEVKSWLKEERHEVVDVGAMIEDLDDDYVDFAVKVVNELLGYDPPSARWPKGPAAGAAPVRVGPLRGVLFCRNGFGMVMAANRFGDVRCGFGFDQGAVEKGRFDDDINCLAVPADYVDVGRVKEMIEVFLKTEFGGEERYVRRLNKLNNLAK